MKQKQKKCTNIEEMRNNTTCHKKIFEKCTNTLKIDRAVLNNSGQTGSHKEVSFFVVVVLG